MSQNSISNNIHYKNAEVNNPLCLLIFFPSPIISRFENLPQGGLKVYNKVQAVCSLTGPSKIVLPSF